MKHKSIAILMAMMLMVGTLQAQHVTRVNLNKGEKWWGIFVTGGTAMPLDDPFEAIDLATWSDGVTTPFLVSNLGRYIWSGSPFTIAFTGSSFLIDSPIQPVEVAVGGKTLREAYLVCRHRNFPPDGTLPALELFRAPVYTLSAQLPFEATADQIEQYASEIIGAGYPVGTLLLPAGWSTQVGTYTTDKEQFNDFTQFVQRLHDQGFKVMLPITPYVSGDGQIFRDHRGDGHFLSDEQGRPILCEWEGGLSACYDLTVTGVADHIAAKIDTLHRVCGVDGFLFDSFGAQPAIAFAAGGAEQFSARWRTLCGNNSFVEYTLTDGQAPRSNHLYQLPPTALVDANFLREMQLNALNAGLLGAPHLIAEPDVEGAGMLQADGMLMLRYLQLMSVMPVMQLVSAPWRTENASLREAYRQAVQLRTRIGGYFAELATESAKTAEPLIRSMEYLFPRNGFSDCDDQFMVGNRYLVAPILGVEQSRMVRFPRGVWVDERGHRFKGPLVVNVESTENRLLIFEPSK